MHRERMPALRALVEAAWDLPEPHMSELFLALVGLPEAGGESDRKKIGGIQPRGRRRGKRRARRLRPLRRNFREGGIVTIIYMRWPGDTGCPVPPTETRKGWHRHPNGGGWVSDCSVVDDDCMISVYSVVRGHSLVLDRSEVRDHSVVTGRSVVRGHSVVLGGSEVSGGSEVRGGSSVIGAAVRGSADVLSMPGHGAYPATLYRTPTGWVLRYGCEHRGLDEWDGLHERLAKKHRPSEAQAYAAHTRRLVEIARAHVAAQQVGSAGTSPHGWTS